MEETTLTNGQLMEQRLEEAGIEIEKLMGDFPCLRELCHLLKPAAYPAAVFTGAALYGTLMTRTYYYFYHRAYQERRLNYGIYIIGHPATGKSFAERLAFVIADPIEKQTEISLKEWNNYKRRLKRWEDGGKKGEGPVKPPLLIRSHPARTANKVFIEDMMNCVEMVDGKEMTLHQLSFDSELDNVTTQNRDHWKNKDYMELKAFHNEKDGEFFMNNDSPVGEFNVFWNYIYTGTPLALKKKINAKNIGSGLATRIAAIPMPKTHFEMMPLEEYDPDKTINKLSPEEQTLRSWAERLDKVHGELPIRELVLYTYKWTKMRMEDAKEDDSEAEEMMVKRIPYYGIHISIPFILMRHWHEWQEKGTISIDDTDIRLCQLVMNIQYMCQDFFFGDLWEDYFKKIEANEAPPFKRHTEQARIRFRRLPEEFDVYMVQKYCGVKKRNADKMIERWCQDHYIERVETGLYRKLYLELT